MRAKPLTDEEILASVRKTIEGDKKLQQCVNCAHCNRAARFCSKINKPIIATMYGCRHFVTNEESLLIQARRLMESHQSQSDKITYLLEVVLTMANTTVMLCTDVERRIKMLRNDSDLAPEFKSDLRKDLDLAESITQAYRKTAGFAKDIEKSFYKIEQQYQFYVQSHLDKIFKRGGEYDEEAYNQHQSDSGEVALFVLEFLRAVHHNAENSEKIIAYMRSLQNSEGDYCCLDDKDIERFRMRE